MLGNTFEQGDMFVFLSLHQRKHERLSTRQVFITQLVLCLVHLEFFLDGQLFGTTFVSLQRLIQISFPDVLCCLAKTRLNQFYIVATCAPFEYNANCTIIHEMNDEQFMLVMVENQWFYFKKRHNAKTTTKAKENQKSTKNNNAQYKQNADIFDIRGSQLSHCILLSFSLPLFVMKPIHEQIKRQQIGLNAFKKCSFPSNFIIIVASQLTKQKSKMHIALHK